MDTADLDADELFLGALECVVLAALDRIGDDPQPRFRFFRQVPAVAQKAAGEVGQLTDLAGLPN